MLETNFLTSDQISIKKPKKKIVRKKKTGKAPSKISENLDISQAITKAEFKAKDNLPVAPKSLPTGQAGEAKNFRPVRNNISNGVYRKIAVSFIVLTVVLALAVLYFGFAKVTLNIIPTQEKITDSLSLEIIDQANSAVIGQGQISGIVRQEPVEQSQIFTSSGQEILGEEVVGKVTIINDYMKNQPLMATTRLLSQDNKLFRLKNTINVPAGGKVEAEVYADEAKPEMAIGPSKFTIPGLWAGLQDKIYALSQEPMKYTERVKHIIKQSDIDNAVSALKQELLTKAKQEAGQAYQEYNQSIIEIDNNSISQEVQGKVGEEKENFTITMKAKLTIVAFKDTDIYKQAGDKLATALADDKEIVNFSQSDTTYSLGNINLSQSTAALNVNFTAKVTLKDSASIIKKSNLTGLSEKQLTTYLKSLPEVAGYEINFFPSFIRKMPNLVDRIEIVIKK